MKSFKKMLVVVTVVAATLTLFAFVGGTKQAVVTSSPLSCFEREDALVCIDGSQTDNLQCAYADETTILCTSVAG